MTNPPDPLFKDESAVAASEAWRTSDPGAGGYWVGPNRLAVGMGRVFVLDYPASSVYALDAETGEPAATIGGEGGGPGELERPFGIVVVADSLFVGNSSGPRIDVFTADGRYERSIRFGFPAFGMESTEEGRFLLMGLQEGEEIDRLVTPDGVMAPFEPPDTSLVDPELSFGACPRWGAGQTGLLRGYCRRLAFQQLTPEGDLVREVSVDRPPVLATNAELDRFEKRMLEMVGRTRMPAEQADRFIKNQLAIARVKAVFQEFRADPTTGYVYVLEETPFVLGGGPATLHRFDRGGRYLDTVSFGLPWRDFQVLGNRVFALAEDPGTGLRTVIAYDLRPAGETE